MADDFRWAPCTKDPEEDLPVVLNLFGLCAHFWEPNEEYELGDIVWPVVTDENGYISGIGYCFEATQAGRSGSRQPKFAKADGTVTVAVDAALAKLDGSVEWTCRAPSSGGFDVASNPVATAPDGITVSAVSVNESMKLLVDYSGGTAYEDYEVKFAVDIAGRQRIGRQLVQVRPQ